MEYDLVVTRHPSLIGYFRKEGIINDDIEILSSANREDVINKNVIGVLPHWLSCHTKSYTEVTLKVPNELRGKELSEDQIRDFVDRLRTYVVSRKDNINS